MLLSYTSILEVKPPMSLFCINNISWMYIRIMMDVCLNQQTSEYVSIHKWQCAPSLSNRIYAIISFIHYVCPLLKYLPQLCWLCYRDIQASFAHLLLSLCIQLQTNCYNLNFRCTGICNVHMTELLHNSHLFSAEKLCDTLSELNLEPIDASLKILIITVN